MVGVRRWYLIPTAGMKASPKWYLDQQAPASRSNPRVRAHHAQDSSEASPRGLFDTVCVAWEHSLCFARLLRRAATWYASAAAGIGLLAVV